MCLSPPSSSCMVSKTTSLFRCTTPVTRAVVILLFGLHVANVLASVPLEVGAVPLRADGRRHFRDWGKLTDKELDDIAMQWDDNEGVCTARILNRFSCHAVFDCARQERRLSFNENSLLLD